MSDVLEQLFIGEQYFARGDARGLRRICKKAFPRAADRPYLNDLVDLALGLTTDVPPVSRPSKVFAENMLSVAARRAAGPSSALIKPQHGRRVVGRDLDILGERHDVEDWTIARALNYLQLRQIKPTRKAAVVGTMRDDGIYALEFVAHYRALGFDTIIIYSNDNADYSEHLLRRLAEHGVIIFIESETDGSVRPEVKAFEHAVYFVPELRDHEWVLFVDSDEFLIPAARFDHSIGRIIDELDAQPPRSRPSAVLYQWMWYNSNMCFERTDGLLMDRFRYAVPHWLTKPMARVRDLLTMRLQHVPELCYQARMVYSDLQPVELDHVWQPREPNYAGGRLNHYWPKSFQEFSLKKARGDALPLADDEYRRGFSLFFQWNAPDSAETRVEPDDGYLARVRDIREYLRSLDGVRECEAAVERRFTVLLERYQADGGLAKIYESLKATTEYGQSATV